MIGATISHYRILDKLGEGGMGVVYKAEDIKLKRTVALKFLSPSLTTNEESKQRFIHEAQAASALQHNNICTVHDIEEIEVGPAAGSAQPGRQMFIVMDYYEGENLKSRIAKGELRVEEAVDIAMQVAGGLREAHKHNIIHRDVKSANILITGDGIAKIVDFGLAKLSGVSDLTRTGSTLGTVAYMSPEQLQGCDLDVRADIFSLGVVLFEMLTGRMPFQGDHEAAMMYSIMNDEPEPLQNYVPGVSAELIHIVSRALEKLPEDRYKTMDDLLIDLRRLRKETSKVPIPPLKRSFRVSISRRAAIVTSAIILASVAAVLFLLNQPMKLPRLNPNRKESAVPLPSKMVYYSCLSHDGNWIAFSGADENKKWDLYYMNSSGGGVRRVTRDSNITAVSDISRDGAWILCTRPHPRYGVEFGAVQPLGGSVRFLGYGFMARFLGTTERIIYQKSGPPPSKSGKYEVWSMRLDGSDNHSVFADPGFSHLAYGMSCSLSPSPDGKSFAWIKTSADFSQDIITHNLETGSDRQVTFSRTLKDEVFWTHNNFLLYSSYSNGSFDLWICPAEGGESRQLTVSRLPETNPQLSDDGSKLLYFENSYSGNIRSMDLQTGKITSITSDDQNRVSFCPSPDGRYFAYTKSTQSTIVFTNRGIEIIDKTQERPVWTIASEELTGHSRAWSPDGKWLAYTRAPDSVGKPYKICVISPLDGTAEKILTEAKSNHGLDSFWFRWMDDHTLSWFSDMRTWACSIDGSKPRQLYQDSTNVYYIQKDKYIVIGDFRAGHRGWWIDQVASSSNTGGHPAKKLTGTSAFISPTGKFMLAITRKGGEMQRISLPDGKTEILPYRLPTLDYPVISQDGRSLFFIEIASSQKLMLWENPFIWE